jgi:beta-xylosidase
MKIITIHFIFLSFLTKITAQNSTHYISKVHVADKGDGTYKNPILYADYSDPDAIRVGDDYYMTASSFAHSPALPILHSKDLVNWTLINHAFIQQKPLDHFNKPQHGNGVWAPAFRFHKGWYYIFWGDPDFGIYRIRTRDPKGAWEEPLLIKSAKGWIDPCPFWDDDGQAYLSHAFAGSRAGFKSVIVIHRMDTEGIKLLDDGVMVFDGHDNHPTVEGTKMHKRNGLYYISAPAGGVATGWELILRSKNIYGPYEEKIALARGKSPTNGPHQGAWITTQTGEYWFLHFQDKGAYGRILHLQPMIWKNDFPIIGIDPDGDGTGEPVLSYKKPNVGKTYPIQTPQESDEFNNSKLGLQWQWQANNQPFWAYSFPSKSFLRLNAVLLPDSFSNYWDVPNILMQKFPAETFTATTKLTFNPRTEGERVGLIIFGLDYSFLSMSFQKGKLFLSQTTCIDAEKKNKPEVEIGQIEISEKTFYMRVTVSQGAACDFSYSLDGKIFTPLGTTFTAKEGKWVGAKMGLFCSRVKKINDAGTVDVDWFRVEKGE